jgi:hypothetical protein
VNLVLGHRPVFDVPRDDQELALPQPDVTVSELHAEPAAHHQDQLVLVVVVVPDELADELDQLDLLAVQVADHLRTPVVVEQAEHLPQVHLLHSPLPQPGRTATTRRRR